MTLVSPCHSRFCSGGPARVWCSTCGRQFQADDPRLLVRPEPATPQIGVLTAGAVPGARMRVPSSVSPAQSTALSTATLTTATPGPSSMSAGNER